MWVSKGFASARNGICQCSVISDEIPFSFIRRLHSMTDRRHLKPQRKQRSVANPVKNLQSRDDLITEVPSNKTNEVKV